jgi:hypothetical protein
MRVHVFDMDGHVAAPDRASLLLASALGNRDALAVLEERLAAGALTAVEFAML